MWIPLIVLVAWSLVPILWSFAASLKTPLEVYRANWIPEDPTFANYRELLGSASFWRYFGNSAFLALTSAAIAVFCSVLAAYGFARYAFRFRNLLLVAILIPRILPRASLIVPLYELVERLGLLDTYVALILTYTATAIPLSTWILIGFFHAVPVEFEEAAAIDGATLWQRLWRVVVPIAVPGMVTVGVLALREAWNEFPFVLALTTGADKRTLPYQLFLLRDSMGIQDWPLVNAFTILTIVPILILYLIFERRIVSGLTSGALK
ncbi:MAG: carbohydrate ABC transporter permease [Trueperaceae bacterium]|nr:carbohydrate ABC transporter permease [Trueperaceae bacterium]